ncbi:internal head protein [Pseudomonas phage Noxifer]|uniref:Virion structural protein n=1 Tax=Pseudomonas phage Noxifer TaxID=2006684 RepID=A0A1Y0SXK0_9CAUD|nr:internal head protein [Pseudomonas phage Noxifer]ARV77344.1 virion structural protein [Pseudomonas phage Noxifer]
MSENNLSWLERVSNEDSTNVNLKPEGVDTKNDEAENIVEGDEKMTAEGVDKKNNHEVVIKDDTTVEDNAVVKKADSEIGVKVSKEDGDQKPDFEINLQTGKPSKEDAEEEEEEGDQPLPDEVGAPGEPGADEPFVPAGDEPTDTIPAGEEPAIPAEPAVEPGADQGVIDEGIPAVAENAPVPTGDELTEPAAPTEPVDPALAEEPVIDETTVDAPVVEDGTAAPLPVAGGETEPAIGADTPVDAAAAGAEGSDVQAELETGDAGLPPINEETPPEAEKIPVAIDPIIEIKEGTDAAVADAIADGEPLIEEEQPEAFDDEAADTGEGEFDEQLEDVEDLSAMQVAVEGYDKILRELDARGEPVSPALAQSIHIGLRSFRDKVLIEGVPSVEDFKDSIGVLTVSQELMNDMGDKVKAVGEAVMNAIKRLLEILVNTAAEIKNDVPGMLQKNDELAKRLSAIQTPYKGQVDVSGASRLFVKNNFVGDQGVNYAQLRTFADRFMIDYPKFYATLAANIEKSWFSTYDMDNGGEHDLTELAVIIGEGFRPGMFGVVQTNDVPNGERYDNNFASPLLLGNGRVVVHMSKSATKAGVASLSDVWSVEFARVDGGANPSMSVSIPDLHQLKGVLGELDKLIKQVPYYTEATRKMAQDQRMTKVFTHRMLVGVLGEHGASGLVASMTKPTGQFIGHVVNTIKVAQRFIEYCIKTHESQGKA